MSEIPLEEQNTNLDEDWGYPAQEGEEIGWGEYNPNSGGGWGEEETNPFLLGDMYIVLLETKEKPFLCSVDNIIEEEKLVYLTDKNETSFIFSYTGDYNFVLKTKDYDAIEIIKVKPFDVEIDEYNKEQVEIEFETELKTDLEKEYSETIQKDDVLSHLIRSYNIYDNPFMIEYIHRMTENFIDLINMIQKTEDKKIMKDWLVPIFDNDIQMYLDEGNDSILDAIDLSENKTDGNYSDIINNNIKYSNPYVSKEGIGYQTTNYKGTILRNCIQSVCTGINGEYTYDERKTRQPLMIPVTITNYKNESINEFREIVSSDKINIVGLLEEPYDKSYYSYSFKLFDDFTIYEKYIFDISWSDLQVDKKKYIKKIPLVDNLALEDSLIPELNKDVFISHNFSETISDDKLNKIIQQNTRSEDNIVDLLLKNKELSTNILNYNDFKNALFKYTIEYRFLNIQTRKKIDTLISDNISEKIQDYSDHVGKRTIDPIKIRKTPLTNFKRVELAYDYIFSLLSEEKRNILLKEFIYKFTRTADKVTEDNNFLYNKYTDKKLLCKHYLYLIEVNNSNDVFNTMKNMFGNTPKDGHIHCKYCNEFLCNEEYSTLQGFSDDTPINTYEILKTDNSKEIIDNKLKDKEDTIRIIKIFGNMIGVNLEDEDIYNILLSGENFMNDILADNRYKLTEVTQSDVHPRVNKALKENKELERKEKNPQKKIKYKKKSQKIMAEFQKWIKTTNKLLILVSLVSLFIQTSIPSFNIQKNPNFIIIEENDSVNDKGIEYLVFQLKKIIGNYSSDPFFNECLDLVNNKDSETIEDQLKRTIIYCNSSSFPAVLERKRKYREMIESKKRDYLKEEWTTYKPLSNNVLVQDINKYLKDIHNPKLLRKLYGGPLIENISMIKPLIRVEEERIEETLKIPSFEILQNSSFKRIFRYVVSCYGIHKNNQLINLFLQNLLETTEKSDKIRAIFKKYGWRDDTQSFRNLSFKDFRDKIIPEIFGLYSKDEVKVSTCFNNPDSCNQYIHNLVNNYDLPQLNTYPKRIYGYSIPKSYPSFEECNEESIKKLFNKFRFNKGGDIIQDIDSINYLDSYLLKVDLIGEEIEIIPEGKKIPITSENFQKIIEYKQNKNILRHNPVVPIINKYSEEEYTEIEKIISTDSRILKYLQTWNNEEIDTDEINNLIKKLPKSLTQTSEPPLDFYYLNRVHYEVSREYTQEVLNNNSAKLKILKDSFEPIYSEYVKIYKENISKISLFISQSDKISKDQKRRFEKIFSGDSTKKIKFNSKTIETILNSFISSSLDYNDLIIYIQDIQNIIVQLNKNPGISESSTGDDIEDESISKHNILSNNIPKEWKLSPSIENNFKKFYERDDTDGVKHKSYLLLHNRIFTQPMNDSYSGFNNYKNISKNSHLHLESLYDYLSKYFSNLEWLKGNNRSLFNDRYSTIYLKFHFIEILSKIHEYIESLKSNQLDVINDAMPLYRLLEERNEDLLEESIHVCSSFLIDLVTHLLLQHYDTTWLFMNKQELDLKNRLSKQREGEKQKIVEKYHNVSSEERLLLKNQQETGQTNQFKEASESYGKYVNSEEYALSTESQRAEKIQEIFAETLEYEDIEEFRPPQLPQLPERIPEEDGGEEGYYDENDFDENNEEFMIGLDEEQDVNYLE